MRYELPIHPAPFEQIHAGKKRIERRVNYKDWAKIVVGDELLFIKRPDFKEQLLAKVTEVSKFESFDALIAAYDLAEQGYEGESLQRLKAGDHGLYEYYTPEQERAFGVVALRFELV